MFRFGSAFIELKTSIRPMAQSLDRAQYMVDKFAARIGKMDLGKRLTPGLSSVARGLDGLIHKSNLLSKALNSVGKSLQKSKNMGRAKKFDAGLLKDPKAAAKNARSYARDFTRQVGMALASPQTHGAISKGLGSLGQKMMRSAYWMKHSGNSPFFNWQANALGNLGAKAFLGRNSVANRVRKVGNKVYRNRGFAKAAGNVAQGVASGFNSIVKIVKPAQTLQYALGGLMKGFAGIFDWVVKLMNPFQLITNLFQGLITTAGNLISTLGKLALGGVVAVFAGMMFATKAAGDMESAMVNIGRVAGLTGDKLKDLKKNLLDIASKSSGASLHEINQIAELGARLGIGEGMANKVELIGKFTKDISKLKLALDEMPVDEAATKIVRILNVFGEGPDKILNFASALVRLDNASTATASDILELTRRLSGITSVMGMIPEDVMALGATMRDIGLEVHVGGTAIQQLFVKMASSADQFAKILKLNKNELKNAIDTRPLEAVRMVLQSLSKFNPRSQMMILSQLRMQGRQSASTILQLSQGFEKLSGFMEMARDDWQSMASVESAAATRAETLWAKLQKLWNQLNVLGEAIGSHLLPAFKELAEFFGDILTKATTFVNGFGSQMDGLVNKVVLGIKFIRAAFADWPKTMEMVSEFIKIQLEAITDWFSELGRNIVKALQSIGQFLVDALSAAWPIVQAAATDLGTMIGDAIMSSIREATKGTWFESLTTPKKVGNQANKQNRFFAMDANGKIVDAQKGGGVPAGKQPAMAAPGVGQAWDKLKGFFNPQMAGGAILDMKAHDRGKRMDALAAQAKGMADNFDRAPYRSPIAGLGKAAVSAFTSFDQKQGKILKRKPGPPTAMDHQMAAIGFRSAPLDDDFDDRAARRTQLRGFESEKSNAKKYFGFKKNVAKKFRPLTGRLDKLAESGVTFGGKKTTVGDLATGVTGASGVVGKIAQALHLGPALKTLGELGGRAGIRKGKSTAGMEAPPALRKQKDFKMEFLDPMEFAKKIQLELFDVKEHNKSLEVAAIEQSNNSAQTRHDLLLDAIGTRGGGLTVMDGLKNIDNSIGKGVIGVAG